ncbi:hypothetical protein [Riemerella anatipestifer]|uniref:hypothetical protein n=1 Tax=Riemerella anatipestifer TaxID=34085 RepID=UPI0021F86CCD|nr:hypothetical protein [Riemerella anatipestifer]MCW0517935.1 hypothetical protein [Riemerella anatipestifer]WIT94505.1 hypothetical protein CRP19_000074 [Riemerella phage vB_RanS_CRP19]
MKVFNLFRKNLTAEEAKVIAIKNRKKKKKELFSETLKKIEKLSKKGFFSISVSSEYVDEDFINLFKERGFFVSSVSEVPEYCTIRWDEASINWNEDEI